jgi:hypothetical protein
MRVFTPIPAEEAKKERIEVTVQIPETTEALWSQIDKDTKVLAELVAATKKDEVARGRLRQLGSASVAHVAPPTREKK